MATPGKMLREARERREWTVEDAANATRLSTRYIRNLEADRFDEFKADIFTRGYIRNYARELETNEHEILAAFEKEIGAQRIEHISEVSEVESKSRRRRDIKVSHFIGAVLALIGLVVFVGLVAGSRATAEDPAQFEEESVDSEVEKDVKKTRWLLEQPPDERDRLRR